MQTVTPTEKWCRVTGYPNYEVSSLGRVRNVARQHFMGLSPGRYRNKRYVCLRVCLSNRHGLKVHVVHRLVAHAFLGPKPDGMEIDHLDGNPMNNAADNLEYVTHAENMRRAKHVRKGEGHDRAKVTDEIVREIRRREAAGTAKSARLAVEFGINLKAIYNIRKGRSWKHVT
jgi:hypothetical protein